ncbi:MAG: TRAP transporter small permease subunit [Xanthomonadales bacterium]|nr:TRAP transporter small permease subunit [Gammaproteobacteria bacterium]NNL95556.1 TRAP transporter small permease subunit [Xanthomonadales bacterium]
MTLIEALVSRCGRIVSWLTLALVVLTFSVVVLRYGFNLGWIWLQESITYLHAAVFMLAAAWTLGEDGHVRVDIFYRNASPRFRALVNMVGCILFLLPFCIFLIIIGWDYVASSWRRLEGSREAGGLGAVFLLKSLILLLPALLLVQCLPMMRRNFDEFRNSGNGAASQVHDA